MERRRFSTAHARSLISRPQKDSDGRYVMASRGALAALTTGIWSFVVIYFGAVVFFFWSDLRTGISVPERLFVVPFLLGGVVLVVLAIFFQRQVSFPSVELFLPSESLPRGAPHVVQWRLVGGRRNLRKLRILVKAEDVYYDNRGPEGDEKRVPEILWTRDLVETSIDRIPAHGSLRFELPADVPASRASESGTTEWSFVAKGEGSNGVLDFTFPLEVT